MKKIILFLIGAGVLSAIQSHAIVGLTIKPQGQNVVLSWPSTSAASYIVQYRDAFDASHQWQTLATVPGLDGTTTYSDPMTFPTGGSQSSQTMATTTGITTLSTTDTDTATDSKTNSRPMPPLPPGLILNDDGSITVAPAGTMASMVAAAGASGAPLPGTPPQGGDGIAAPPTYRFYRVVANGANIVGVNNGDTVWGTLTANVEMGVLTGTSVDITLTSNGNPLPGVTIQPDSTGAYTLNWDTTLVQNGSYTISAQVNLDNGTSVPGIPVTVTVNNIVSFPLAMSRIFSDQVWINSQLSVQSADWEIDIYGDGTYVGTFSGTTTDGTINFTWNLLDPNSNYINANVITGDYYIYPTYGSSKSPNYVKAAGSSGSSGTGTWARETKYSSNAKGFVVAWGALDTIPQHRIEQEAVVSGGVNDIIGDLIANGYQLSPGNTQYGGVAYRMSDTVSRDNLLTYLSQSDYINFYWCGHGSPSLIDAVDPNTTVDMTRLHSWLKNFPTATPAYNSKPFKLVVLDCCYSGNGNICEAFGITRETVSRQYFFNAGVRPRAFLSYTDENTFNFNQWQNREAMLAQFWSDWMHGNTLQYCVANAVAFSLCHMDSKWVIYGAPDLTINSL